jgi:serine/threonine-protein kinase
MLYRTVTGRHPFESDSHYELMMAHVHEPVPPPSQYRPELPAAFEALIVDALAKAPSDRPEDCAAMRRRMDVALADTPAGRASVPSAPRPPVIASGSGPDMVLVPPGAFAMGPSRREVFLDAFYAARTPVTNAQFEAFVRVTGYRPSDAMADRFLAHWRGGGCPPALADHPVVFVSWLDAQAYCAWAGRRLPTEAEWEKAARGDDGRKYPWGKTDPSAERANYGRARSGHTSPVDAHPAGASPYGLLDMAGNVWEWCEDVDDPAFYLRGPERNPRRTVGDGARVARGGSFMYDARSLRTFSRASFEPTFRFAGIGFRCALSAT